MEQRFCLTPGCRGKIRKGRRMCYKHRTRALKKPPCAVTFCSSPSHSRGWCQVHYRRWWVHGDPLAYKNPIKQTKCERPGCTRPFCAKGLCATHYSRVKSGRPIDAPLSRRRNPLVCVLEGCGKDQVAKGLCRYHYRRQRAMKPCSVEGCHRKAEYRNHCATHLSRIDRHGDPLSGARFVYPIGHKKINREGYVLIKTGSGPQAGYDLEHRVVMATRMGRPLHSFENVHHRNGVRADNTSENLELWITMQPIGKHPEDLVAYARRILELYA